MPLDRFPGPLGRNAHRLVVVAGGASGGEGVAEPEAVGLGYAVGDVGEARRALVGGDHQIGIVIVVDDDALRGQHLAVGVEVVGDVQQA